MVDWRWVDLSVDSLIPKIGWQLWYKKCTLIFISERTKINLFSCIYLSHSDRVHANCSSWWAMEQMDQGRNCTFPGHTQLSQEKKFLPCTTSFSHHQLIIPEKLCILTRENSLQYKNSTLLSTYGTTQSSPSTWIHNWLLYTIWSIGEWFHYVSYTVTNYSGHLRY